WVAEVEAGRLGHVPAAPVRLVKGSHIVVPRLYQGDHAYVLQNDDRRIVFAIPYEDEFTLIGTTELDLAGPPDAAAVTAEETDYLCRAVSRWFARPVTPADVVWSFSGVRPLDDDGRRAASPASRDYRLDLDTAAGAPLLSVRGGKLTSYRRLAARAVDRLARRLGRSGPAWTAGAPLPGGDLPSGDLDGFRARLRACCPWLPGPLADRYAGAYGSRVDRLLGGA